MHNLSSPKRILITGASRGIGRETARQLTRAGHVVIAVARDASALGELARSAAADSGKIERV